MTEFFGVSVMAELAHDPRRERIAKLGSEGIRVEDDRHGSRRALRHDIARRLEARFLQRSYFER